ncbi:GDP-mannose-dependent alpha-(1-6)-phosphatidylinositol monomannoside mannosyltransferase [Labrenzia sp. THAF82]|uniref:glycosyltransferase n=1 Tax=Labrenzia sp. THAF82 TaxID=2587861 RepID=UPI0012689956|nr:glycosyltransferase [Labrenzia sp. THAF82]QFT28923.1 GDP-mannose-dependent alpha-(1-6)-phosphatidylinositol monomannoside mannosyltransferase [Labrenzia sp. THAF82]
MTKICIFTAAYREAHHTFVNFHIENLFEGSASVCCTEEIGNQGSTRNLLVRTNVARSPWHKLQVKLGTFVRKRRKLPIRGIYGSERSAIINFLQAEKIDVVLCEFGCIGSEVAESISGTGIPIYSYFRGYDATARLSSAKERRFLARTVPKLKGAFFVSRYLLNNLAQYGIRNPNSHVIPSGVNTDEFVPGQKNKGTFLAVGSLIEKKRPDITVGAFCREAKTHPRARLTIIGGGRMLTQCLAIVKEHDMEDQVQFLGEQPHDIVMNYLRKSEFFLQHSVTGSNGDGEGAPTAIQEALACGCVVLSTRHAGIPELVTDGETGFLVDELDQAGFQGLIKSALQDEIDVCRIAKQSREHSVQYLDNRALIKKLEGVLSRATAVEALS